MPRLKIIILTILFIISQNVLAVREINITEGQLNPIPIAINFFSSQGKEATKAATEIINIINNDLRSCNFFKILPTGAFIENKIGVYHRPLFASWRQISAQLLLNGHIKQVGHKLEISFILWDPTLEKEIHKEILSLPLTLWRRGAHKISDTIYEQAIGDKGYFDTRVAYISENVSGNKIVKRLSVMDYDGYNHRYLTDGKDLVLTPRFSPKADKILYMSYSHGVPKVYIKDIATNKEHLIGNFPGMSFAPRFSPDGTKALMSVARNGSSNIIEVNLHTKKVRKLTDSYCINTSPSYSPDGKKIVFNSDRSGSRQLYVMDSDGFNVTRISFGGNAYATPVWSPKGDFIAFTKMSGGFAIGVMRTDGTDERIIANGYLVEGPTWSPSGRMIMYTKESKASTQGKRVTTNKIYTIDLSGYNERMLRTPSNASDAEWSALLD